MNEIVKYSSRIEAALDRVEVQNKLTRVEYKICKLKNGLKIRDMEEEIYIKNIGMSIKMIASIVGIKEVEPEDTYQFQRFVKIYYDFFTIDEINTAFDMALVGQLDKYLPIGKNGTPDRNHYQRFSMDYVTKILNAYKKMLSAAVIKAYQAIPPKKYVITEKEKIKNQNALIDSILDKFIAYRSRGIRPDFLVNQVVMNLLMEKKFIDKVPEVTEDAIEIAYKSILRNGEVINDLTKDKIIKDRNYGIKNDKLNSLAYKYECSLVVQRWFDEILEKGLDINKLLK